MLKGDQSIWDIGADIGTFALAMAALSKDLTVFVIEADPELPNLIVKASRFNQDQRPNIHILPSTVFRVQRSPSQTSWGCVRAAQTSETQEVPSHKFEVNDKGEVQELTLDQLADIIGTPDFINLSMQGSELVALQGATTLLTNHKPAIYLDCTGQSYPECVELLKNQGYQIFTYSTSNASEPDYCALFVHSEDEAHLSRLANMRANFC